jgi:branched-chain amino acid transporter
VFPLQQIQQTTAPVQNSFWAGFHDGVPIGLGYLSVSVTFGMMAVTGGLPVWAAVAISMTNVTSAGQFAGLSLIFGGGTLFETALTQFVINLRYALMSLSLSQKLERRVGLIDRMLFSFMMTDEVFAVASGQKGEVGKRYLFGVMIAPYCGWALGTLCGAVASGFLPPSVRSALSIAIYGMFIAIVVPVAKQSRAVLGVVALAVALSCAMHWLPVLNTVSSGFSIILCTVLAAGLGALAAPVPDEPSGAPDGEVA